MTNRLIHSIHDLFHIDETPSYDNYIVIGSNSEYAMNNYNDDLITEQVRITNGLWTEDIKAHKILPIIDSRGYLDNKIEIGDINTKLDINGYEINVGNTNTKLDLYGSNLNIGVGNTQVKALFDEVNSLIEIGTINTNKTIIHGLDFEINATNFNIGDKVEINNDKIELNNDKILLNNENSNTFLIVDDTNDIITLKGDTINVEANTYNTAFDNYEMNVESNIKFTVKDNEINMNNEEINLNVGSNNNIKLSDDLFYIEIDSNNILLNNKDFEINIIEEIRINAPTLKINDVNDTNYIVLESNNLQIGNENTKIKTNEFTINEESNNTFLKIDDNNGIININISSEFSINNSNNNSYINLDEINGEIGIKGLNKIDHETNVFGINNSLEVNEINKEIKLINDTINITGYSNIQNTTPSFNVNTISDNVHIGMNNNDITIKSNDTINLDTGNEITIDATNKINVNTQIIETVATTQNTLQTKLHQINTEGSNVFFELDNTTKSIQLGTTKTNETVLYGKTTEVIASQNELHTTPMYEINNSSNNAYFKVDKNFGRTQLGSTNTLDTKIYGAMTTITASLKEQHTTKQFDINTSGDGAYMTVNKNTKNVEVKSDTINLNKDDDTNIKLDKNNSQIDIGKEGLDNLNIDASNIVIGHPDTTTTIYGNLVTYGSGSNITVNAVTTESASFAIQNTGTDIAFVVVQNNENGSDKDVAQFITVEDQDRTALRIDGEGRVGIGYSKTSNIEAWMHLTRKDPTDTVYPMFRVDDYENDTTPFIIQTDGKVGVGIENPEYEMDVSGDLQYSGTFYSNGIDILSTLQTKLENDIQFGNQYLVTDIQTSTVLLGGDDLNQLNMQASNIDIDAGTLDINVDDVTFTGDTFVIDGELSLKHSVWHKSTDTKERFYFTENGGSIYRGHGTGDIFEIRDGSDSKKLNIDNNGLVTITNDMEINGDLFLNSTTSTLTLMRGQDGGSRGITYWDYNNYNWGTYMGQSGASKSFSGGTACTGGSFANYAIRFRVPDSVTDGFILENNNEECLFSVRGDGLAYFSNKVGIGRTNPDKNFHVEGDINYTGILYKNDIDILQQTKDEIQEIIDNNATYIITDTDNSTLTLGGNSLCNIVIDANDIVIGNNTSLTTILGDLLIQQSNINGQQNDIIKFITSDDLSVFRIDSEGHVGVGVSTESNIEAWFHITRADIYDVVYDLFRVDDAEGDTTPFIINPDGFVGIRTDKPMYELDVRGDAFIQCNLIVGNFASGVVAKDILPPPDPFLYYVFSKKDTDIPNYGTESSLFTSKIYNFNKQLTDNTADTTYETKDNLLIWYKFEPTNNNTVINHATYNDLTYNSLEEDDDIADALTVLDILVLKRGNQQNYSLYVDTDVVLDNGEAYTYMLNPADFLNKINDIFTINVWLKIEDPTQDTCSIMEIKYLTDVLFDMKLVNSKLCIIIKDTFGRSSTIYSTNVITRDLTNVNVGINFDELTLKIHLNAEEDSEHTLYFKPNYNQYTIDVSVRLATNVTNEQTEFYIEFLKVYDEILSQSAIYAINDYDEDGKRDKSINVDPEGHYLLDIQGTVVIRNALYLNIDNVSKMFYAIGGAKYIDTNKDSLCITAIKISWTNDVTLLEDANTFICRLACKFHVSGIAEFKPIAFRKFEVFINPINSIDTPGEIITTEITDTKHENFLLITSELQRIEDNQALLNMEWKNLDETNNSARAYMEIDMFCHEQLGDVTFEPYIDISGEGLVTE
tara:strand:+ start:7487 stop:12706 length:5220 start_codon:yes stop_codon:yes gene_type:complete